MPFLLMTLANKSLGWTYIKHLKTLSIEKAKEVHQVDHKSSWMDQFVKYLTDDTIPYNPREGKMLKWKASKYMLVDGQLHRKSSSLLKCLRPFESDYVLQEIYEDIYKNHLGAISLAYKALRHGYY